MGPLFPWGAPPGVVAYFCVKVAPCFALPEMPAVEGQTDGPTMLDFAVSPQLVWGYMFGLEENLSAAAHPVVKRWLRQVAEHLPENPTLAADEMQVQSLAQGLA